MGTDPLTPRSGRKIELVVLSAKWCEVCRGLSPELAKLRKNLSQVSIREIDVDDKEGAKWLVEYRVDALPYYFITVDGQIVDRRRGFLASEHAEIFLRDALATLDSQQGTPPKNQPVRRPPEMEPPRGQQSSESWTFDPALTRILGKHESSKELQAFHDQLGESPEVQKFEKYEGSFQNWKSKGVSLSFDGKGILSCVFLYSENSDDGYQAYKGVLPGKLSWEDTRADVHRKFGKPNAVTPGVGRSIFLSDSYDTQGLIVDYHSQDPADTKTRIRMFRIEPKTHLK